MTYGRRPNPRGVIARVVAAAGLVLLGLTALGEAGRLAMGQPSEVAPPLAPISKPYIDPVRFQGWEKGMATARAEVQGTATAEAGGQ